MIKSAHSTLFKLGTSEGLLQWDRCSIRSRLFSWMCVLCSQLLRLQQTNPLTHILIYFILLCVYLHLVPSVFVRSIFHQCTSPVFIFLYSALTFDLWFSLTWEQGNCWTQYHCGHLQSWGGRHLGARTYLFKTYILILISCTFSPWNILFEGDIFYFCNCWHGRCFFFAWIKKKNLIRSTVIGSQMASPPSSHCRKYKKF